MALTYVGGTTGYGLSADIDVSLTSLTGGSASSPATGDIVVVAIDCARRSDINIGVTTSGYSELTELYANDTYDCNLSVSYKIMGSTPDTTVTCTGSGSATEAVAIAIHVWRGIDTSNPIDVTTTTATGTDASDPNSPAITPVTQGAIVLSIGASGLAGVVTLTNQPTGYSNTVFLSSDGGGGSYPALIGIASKAWSGSGAEDPDNWDYSNSSSTSNSWAAATVALRPLGASSSNYSPTLLTLNVG